MSSLLTWLGIGSATLLAVAVAVAWWEHRQRLAELRRELALATDSRFALEEHVREVDQRLQAISVAIQSQGEALAAAREASELKTTLGTALQRMASPLLDAAHPVRPTEWPDTLPMVQAPLAATPSYEPTQPLDLHHH